MQEKHLFEYAVIRVVPRVEREEFLNVGVVLYCKGAKFLGVLYQLDEPKLLAFSPTLALDEVAAQLKSFERICKADGASGVIGKLDAPSRFRWLTATRSTVIQTSRVHPGLCADAQETLQKLFAQLVLV